MYITFIKLYIIPIPISQIGIEKKKNFLAYKLLYFK